MRSANFPCGQCYVGEVQEEGVRCPVCSAVCLQPLLIEQTSYLCMNRRSK